MRSYRIQARYLGVYLDSNVEAESDEQAIDNFIKQVGSGNVKIQKEPAGLLPYKCLVTIEEIEHGNNSSVTTSKEDGARVSLEQ